MKGNLLGKIEGKVSTDNEKYMYEVTFNINPEEAFLIVKDIYGDIMNPIEKNKYKLYGGVYTYTASAENYVTKQDVRLEVYEEMTVDIEFKDYNSINFTEAADEEIEFMLNAHYNGKINIADYWHVGDTRKIHLNASISNVATPTNINEQDIIIVIIGINHDDLVTQTGERTNAAITVQTRECLGNEGTAITFSLPYGVESTSYLNTYSAKSYLENAFKTALPQYIQDNLKKVKLKCLTSHIYNGTTIYNTSICMPSYTELVGNTTNLDYMDDYDFSKSHPNIEGSQYEYFKTSSNRVKYYNNNGVKGTKVDEWITRSPSSRNPSGRGYQWLTVYSSGIIAYQGGSLTGNKFGLAPVFYL